MAGESGADNIEFMRKSTSLFTLPSLRSRIAPCTTSIA